MNIFQKAIQSLESFFNSGKAKAAIEEAAALAVEAAPIVQMISALVPIRTVQNIVATYETYAVPVATQITSDPTSMNNALLNLATALLAKKLSAQKLTVATSILNTAIQLAVIAAKA